MTPALSELLNRQAPPDLPFLAFVRDGDGSVKAQLELASQRPELFDECETSVVATSQSAERERQFHESALRLQNLLLWAKWESGKCAS